VPSAERPIYLDFNATTPVHPEVEEVLLHYLRHEFGNAGSRTHEYGTRARQAVERAREQVAAVVSCNAEDVIFTSGATESNNLALLGLEEFGRRTGRLHVVTTQIEHKAVLEPVDRLKQRGFEVTYLPVMAGGWVAPEAVAEALRPDTLLVSVMHVNNETGVIQPLNAIAEVMKDHNAYFHVDAAQGFGKEWEELRSKRIDLISASAHKIYGPKGVGALIARPRGFQRPPLTPLMVGGGQERGLRPGTQPVFLIAAFGKACEIALRDAQHRENAVRAQREAVLAAFAPVTERLIGDPERVLPSTISLVLKDLDSEAFFVLTKNHLAVASGAACTSSCYQTSHVLDAMHISVDDAARVVRVSLGPSIGSVPGAWLDAVNRHAGRFFAE
jgi:cysteine desulfurase